MKEIIQNAPLRIYLQVGDNLLIDGTDFNELADGVSWCSETVYSTDICYIRAGKKVASVIKEKDKQIAEYKAENERLKGIVKESEK